MPWQKSNLCSVPFLKVKFSWLLSSRKNFLLSHGVGRNIGQHVLLDDESEGFPVCSQFMNSYEAYTAQDRAGLLGVVGVWATLKARDRTESRPPKLPRRKSG